MEERSKLGRRAEEGNGFEGLQGGREGIRERPHRSGSEIRMSRLEIMFVDVAGEMPRNVELVFDERAQCGVFCYAELDP